jgi:hypothetical protein
MVLGVALTKSGDIVLGTIRSLGAINTFIPHRVRTNSNAALLSLKKLHAVATINYYRM